MRSRSLPVVALLILGGGMAAWFVTRARSNGAPLSPGQPHAQAEESGGGETLDTATESAAPPPARDRAPVANGPDADSSAPTSKSAPAALRGFVLAEDDAPVEDFELVLARDALLFGENIERQFHGPKGEFRFDALTPGTWSVEPRAAGYALNDPVPKVKVPRALPLLLRMHRTTLVRGVVVDVAGAPVPEAKAEATRVVQETAGAAQTVDCNEQGEFLFNDLSPGEYAFRALRGEMAANGNPVRRKIEVSKPTEDLRLVLPNGGTITGEIAMARRAEFHAGTVMLLSSIEETRERHVNITQDCAFRFDAVPAGTCWLVADGRNSSDDPGGLLTGQCTVSEGRTTHVVLGESSRDSVHVHGRVLRDGAPLPDTFVSAFLDGIPALDSFRLARVDASGAYELQLDRAGPATFLVSTRNDVDFAAPRTRVLVPKGPDFELDLHCPLGGLRGLVLDARGEPRASEAVWVLPIDSSRIALQGRSVRETQTDEQGRFEFLGLAAGEHLLLAGNGTLERPRGPRARVALRLAAGELRENIKLELPPPGRIHGIVCDAAGRACPDMEVYARGVGGELFQPWPVAASGADGEFACEGLAPGSYSFFARGLAQDLTGRGPLATAPSALVDVHGKDSLEHEIRVVLIASPATLLRVEVLGGKDVQLPSELRLLDDLGQEVGGAVGKGDLDDALAQGAFGHRSRFGPLPPGRYSLEARTEGGRVATQKFTLSGEPEKKLTIRVE